MDALKKEGLAQGDAGEERSEAAAELPVRPDAKVTIVHDEKRIMHVYLEETRRILAGMEEPGRREEIAASGSDGQRGTPLALPALEPIPEQYSMASIIEEPSHGLQRQQPPLEFDVNVMETTYYWDENNLMEYISSPPLESPDEHL